MNLRITEPEVEIHFEAGEPLVQFVVFPRRYVEGFDAQIKRSGLERETFLMEIGLSHSDRPILMARVGLEPTARGL